MKAEFSDRRLPAEWERHEATWLSWPNLDGESFEFGLDVIRESMLEIVRALIPGEEVWINFTLPEERMWLEAQLSEFERSRIRCFEDVAFREPYLRDNGPTFVLENGNQDLIGVKWEFDGWGGKYPPHDLDNTTGLAMAEAAGFPIEKTGIIFEGGAIESDGAGTILVSETCFSARNPTLTKDDGERILQKHLGAKTIHWLQCPHVPGDDTDGHIDVTTRLIGLETLVVSRIPEYLEQLADIGYRLIELPVAKSGTHNDRDIKTPATYANFYIGNETVLVPVFEQSTDDKACSILAKCFPDRTITPIAANEIIKGQGGIHCLTQTIPQRAPRS